MKVIQIGANNGNDDVYQFINNNRLSLELGILIEPIPFIIEELKIQYKDINNIIVENIAISDKEGIGDVELFYLGNSNYEVSSFSKEHVEIHKPLSSDYPLESLKVKCITINQLMDKYNLTMVDYLFIDAEGLDVFIISSINFDKYNFKNIIFEKTHTDGAFNTNNNFDQIVNYLESLGYTITSIDNSNIKASR